MFEKIRTAFFFFFAILEGKEFVSRSSIADEILEEFPHPDGPGGCTREEIYYGSSNFGTGASVPVRLDEKI